MRYGSSVRCVYPDVSSNLSGRDTNLIEEIGG